MWRVGHKKKQKTIVAMFAGDMQVFIIGKLGTEREWRKDTMAKYDFDQIVDRRAINASKWNVSEGIIPMSVANTEFLSPP